MIAGLFARIISLAIAVEMIPAIHLVHLKNGFFINWSGPQAVKGSSIDSLFRPSPSF